MEKSPASQSKYSKLWNKVINSKIIIFLIGAFVYSLFDWVIPKLLSHQSKSEDIFSRIEVDSIFKDSMFGEIPFKGFKFNITNVGDFQADKVTIQLKAFVGMDLGYDPNLVLIDNPSGGDLNTESRYFNRRAPLVPSGTTWLRLSMFEPAYDSLNNLYKAKNQNNQDEIPSISIEYSEGVGKKIPVG